MRLRHGTGRFDDGMESYDGAWVKDEMSGSGAWDVAGVPLWAAPRSHPPWLCVFACVVLPSGTYCSASGAVYEVRVLQAQQLPLSVVALDRALCHAGVARGAPATPSPRFRSSPQGFLSWNAGLQYWVRLSVVEGAGREEGGSTQ